MFLGRLAYKVVYDGDSFLSFPKLVATLSSSNVDVGNYNHSDIFLRRLLPYFKKAISNELQSFMAQPLKCTDKLRPVVLIADKAKVKHERVQGVAVRSIVFEKDQLFNSFYINHPEQTFGTRESLLIENTLSTVENDLNISRNEMRERFAGFVGDGEI